MRERIRRNVGLGMAVILLVSSLGVPPASAGTVREGKSLAEAEMDVRSGPVEYNGRSQRFRFIWTVCLCGRGSITGCPMQTIWMLGPLW